jgi:hypothetical protein
MYVVREDIRPTLGRLANTAAVIVAGFLPATYALVALLLAIGGPSESDNAWATRLGVAASSLGVAMAVLAFVLAGASRLRREPIDSLWLPFTLLPMLGAIALLVYVFWVR